MWCHTYLFAEYKANIFLCVPVRVTESHVGAVLFEFLLIQ